MLQAIPQCADITKDSRSQNAAFGYEFELSRNIPTLSACQRQETQAHNQMVDLSIDCPLAVAKAVDPIAFSV
jgi:hypothetical protein